LEKLGVEAVDLETLSKTVQTGSPAPQLKNCAGSAGTFGTVGGCFGTFGTFGCLGEKTM
jgi:hypothetical protein